MSTAIDQFQQFNNELGYARGWVEMIGKRYEGGGGGIGKIVNCTLLMEVYSQSYDGATNYHDCPKELAVAMAEVIKQDSHQIIDKAIAIMELRAKELAKAAHEEHTLLMGAAGLAVQP